MSEDNLNGDYTNRRYLDALADHVVVFDGANGTQLQAFPLTAEDFGGEALNGCFDALALTRPDVIEQVHSGYFAAGSEVVETNTFRANRITLREYGLQDRIVEINRSAAEAARRAAARFEAETGIPRFVAGSMGPSGLLPASDDPVLSATSFAELADVFREQAGGLLAGGVDLLLIETSQDLLEVKAAVQGVQQAFAETGRRVPLQVQVTLDTTGRMLLGTDVAAALATLEPLPVDVIGLNCSTGPEHMAEPIRYLGEHSRKPISCLPNAGLPLNVDGQAVYPLQPEPFAEAMAGFVRDHGVSAIGGCCGTTPEHIRRLLALIGARPEDRPPRPRRPEHLPAIASMMRATALIQDPPPLLIGERVNSQGSRAVKQLLLADDYDGILQIARDQVDGGAHTLDVCVALTERADEAEQMRQTVKRLAGGVEAPLVIDSTELPALQAALETYPGRAIVNPGSLLDGGPERVQAVLELVSRHRVAVMLMTIDEQGMAKTGARKLEIARRIRDLAVSDYGLAPEDLIFDPLTFTLATGQEEFLSSAVETIAGIRLIKAELPGVLCSLGVSNVSFGLQPAARGVLNSVFLYHCVEAGLDMAIVNPKHVTPYAEIPPEERALADDLIFNRRPDALARFIEHFSARAGTPGGPAPVDATAGLSAEERIHYQILHRKKDGIEALIDEALTRHDPVWVLNNVLLPAMKDVGDRFGAGELILPFVLQSAEVMKRAVRHLEQFLEKQEGVTKGRVVLATVYGDVHDIGKSLVNTILTNNGYTTFDLGKQVPVNVIVDRAVEVGATAVGLSALLVSTSKQMPLVVQELHRRGLEIPVLIGGAAINRKFGRRTLFVEPPGENGEGLPYGPGVFYCKDAFEGLETLDQLIDPARAAALRERTVAEAYHELGRSRGRAARPGPAGPAADRYRPTDIPAPPFWGARTIRAMPLEAVFTHLDRNELFRLSWGAKNAHGEQWQRLQAEFAERLERMQREAQRDGTLEPRAVYGYFPGNAEGDSLVIYDPEPFAARAEKPRANGGEPERREIARFTFPRQPDQERLCLADYFAPAGGGAAGSGPVDVVPLQVVTVGPRADARFAALQEQGEYTEAYFTHGLSVQTAEATAEYVHRHIRRELGLAPERGKRYSWGYPACPDLDDHAIVFRLLPAERELGMTLTPAFQLVPEQSTAAIVVHHPAAVYYSVGVSRVEQLTDPGRTPGQTRS
jgi:5-methyltetrahydrofolate--homocysteine methyltransferase